ncbi:RNA-directed DNA polymerase from mobile element jockey [Geodia barretti]|uniref:RNA-directed DNA polymerase from mobile element jockey n=1 Tax=Geodia barretti TaxID=519541 RepID=A0AA35QTN9_GEOBA|nr:RNA-directed DNA polymerase from mobile element jockey [Geodia barretti]
MDPALPESCQITRREESCTKRINQTVITPALRNLPEGRGLAGRSFQVEHTVNKMKRKKSAGPDNLTAEHLKFGGQTIITWLTEILNSIVDVELIPSCLKLGITIPVYKGGGKDPLNANSYRGITLNSVISKVLETLILNRLEPLFMEAGLPLGKSF